MKAKTHFPRPYYAVKKVFVNFFAKFFEVFAKFFKAFKKFFEVFASFSRLSDPFGPIGMHSEAIGSVWTFSKNVEIFWMFESFFNFSGYIFYTKTFSTAQQKKMEMEKVRAKRKKKGNKQEMEEETQVVF